MEPRIEDVLRRWCMFRIVCTADIEKMYRHIREKDEDQQFQRTLSHSSPMDDIGVYNLSTITCGLYHRMHRISLSEFFVDSLMMREVIILELR